MSCSSVRARRDGPKGNARVTAIVSGCLLVVGVAIIVWFAAWGVHGCDDTDACFTRMDRDFRVYLVGLGSFTLGAVLGVVATVRAVRA
jgi:hypothetical protein